MNASSNSLSNPKFLGCIVLYLSVHVERFDTRLIRYSLLFRLRTVCYACLFGFKFRSFSVDLIVFYNAMPLV